jgi:molybdopterin-guanine dinucleotide biosynthesis protein A
MGRDKASLPFGPGETLLSRTVRLLAGVVAAERIVVVAGRGQSLPALPREVQIVRDEVEGEGPLPALVAGLAAIAGRAEYAFVSGCDAPLLESPLVERLFGLAEGAGANRPFEAVVFDAVVFDAVVFDAVVFDAVVPADVERVYPLAAVYATSAADLLHELAASGVRALHRALADDRLKVKKVPLDELPTFQHGLVPSLHNCNTQSDYEMALMMARLTSRS